MAESIFASATDGAGTIVLVGTTGFISVSTDNGENWTQRVSGTSEDLYGVAYGSSLSVSGWVAVGANGVVCSSSDAVTWSVQTSFTSESLFSVAWGGTFMTIGTTGTFANSADLGVTWEIHSLGTSVDLFDIAVDAGIYTIVGDGGLIITGNLTTLNLDVTVSEDVAMTLTDESPGTFQETVSTDLTMNEYELRWDWDNGVDPVEQNSLHSELVYDHILAYSPGADATAYVNHVITEGAAMVPFLYVVSKLSSALSEATTLSDSNSSIHQIPRTITEVVSILAAESVIDAPTVLEALAMTGPTSAAGIFNRAVIQGLTVQERVVVSWARSIIDGVDITPSNSSKLIPIVELIDRMVSTGVAASHATAFITLTAATSLADAVQGGKGGFITENLEGSDSALYQLLAAASALETAYLSTTYQMDLRIQISDGVVMDDETSAIGILYKALTDGVAFRLAYNLNSIQYSGWVMNTKTFAVSEYTEYPFNSFAKIGTTYVAANQNGLYRLTGDDDAGQNIDAYITTGITDFGTMKKKRVDNVFLGFRTNGDMLLKTVTEGNIERWYEVTGDTDKLHNKRVHPMAKGLKSSWWQFTLANVDGADFELEEIEFIPITLARRV